MKSKLSSIIVAVLCVFIASCKEDKQHQNRVAIGNSDSDRISVVRIGILQDDLAYGGRRGIYSIRDSKTGIEYIGISGVGISETGSHRFGAKGARGSDER